MKLWLIACLLAGSSVFGAQVRERVQAVVAENNKNVQRTQGLYDFLPVPVVNIVFGYLRTRLDTQRFDCYYTPACSVRIIDRHRNSHYFVVPGYLPTRARQYVSIACIKKDVLDPLVQAAAELSKLKSVEETYRVCRRSEEKNFRSRFAGLTLPSSEEIYLSKQNFGPNFIVGYDELREQFAKAQEGESC